MPDHLVWEKNFLSEEIILM